MGKNKVAQIAFGRSVEEEYKDNLHRVSAVSEFNSVYYRLFYYQLQSEENQ
jgi:hypothetical protein